MDGNCTVVTVVPIQEILNGTPDGKLAMFKITSGSDEHVLGEMVYVHREKFWLCMSDEEVPGLKASNVHFQRYIER